LVGPKSRTPKPITLQGETPGHLPGVSFVRASAGAHRARIAQPEGAPQQVLVTWQAILALAGVLLPVRRPNGVPTPVPLRAPWCPRHLNLEYAVPSDAPACTPLGRSGNAVSGVTRIEGSNPSRSGFRLCHKAFRPLAWNLWRRSRLMARRLMPTAMPITWKGRVSAAQVHADVVHDRSGDRGPTGMPKTEEPFADMSASTGNAPCPARTALPEHRGPPQLPPLPSTVSATWSLALRRPTG